MPVDISIILGCRVAGNTNSNLMHCLTGLVERARDPKRIEILIKFDDDDTAAPGVIAALAPLKTSTTIKCIITPRGAGYSDLHKAYDALFPLADEASKLFWVLSDDVEILTQDWDAKLVKSLQSHADGIFVAQTMVNFIHPALPDALEGPDPYPVWTRKWIALQGGFGPCYATDGWTSGVLYTLLKKQGRNRHVFVKGVKLRRRLSEGDQPGSPRWMGIRRAAIQQMQAAPMQAFMEEIAKRLAGAMTPQDTRDQGSRTLSYAGYCLRSSLMKHESGPLRHPVRMMRTLLRLTKNILRLR